MALDSALNKWVDRVPEHRESSISPLFQRYSNPLFLSQYAGDQRLQRNTKHTLFNPLFSGVNFTKHNSMSIG